VIRPYCVAGEAVDRLPLAVLCQELLLSDSTFWQRLAKVEA
jgi:hypothetical protein